jgi:ATP-binding cassette, subfamily F, member 3
VATLTIEGLTITYGAEVVLRDVAFQVEAGQRLAVVGANGSGKSSLLRVIAGELAPAAGSATLAPRTRVAHLPQELEPGPHDSVYEDALHSRPDILRLRGEMTELESALAAAAPEGAEALLARYGDVQHEYQRLDGYAYDNRVTEVLHGVGLRQAEQALQPVALSGGQRRRLALARLLLQDADLLLLDEPTNHLDLEAIEWLEGFLRLNRAAMLIVSHDRRFLDRAADAVLELQAGGAEWYPGNYTQYVRLRGERRARRLKEYDAQQEYIARTEEFIRRYRAGQRAREARGRQTKLDRLPRVARPPEDLQLRIRLQADATSQEVFASQGVRVGYGGRTLVTVPPFVVEAQDRVAIVGPNGSGKTTILKALLGEVRPLEGRVRIGHRARLRYYDQHLADLEPDRTILEELRAASGLPDETLRTFMGRLLFSGDDAFKRIRVLSGGEKSRVALGKLMLDRAGVLLLDEPTNHLDIPAQEMLEEALTDYGGTVVFVSHDRYFIDAIASRLWVIEDGRVSQHLGNYSDFERGRARLAAAAAQEPVETAPRPARRRDSRGSGPAGGTPDLEAEIAAAEAEIRRIEALLADHRTYDDPAEVARLSLAHQDQSRRLDVLYQQWERAAGA